MHDWKTYKLSEISEIVGGGTPSTAHEDYWNGTIPWLTPRDLTNYDRRYISRGERSITEKGLRNSSSRLLPTNTVLMSSRAPIGYLAIAENEICTNQGFKSFVLNEDEVDYEFFYYLLKNNVDYLKSLGTGTTFAEVSAGRLKSVEFQYPGIEEQKAIAKILSSLDDKIELNRRMNATLEAMARALFKAWFVDFEPVHANQQNRPSTSASPEIAKHFPLDLNDGVPIGWDVVKLVDVCERITKGTTPKKFVENGIRFIKAESLSLDRGFVYEKFAYIDEDTNDSLNRSKLKKDDVLFSIAGTIGRIARVVEEILPANTNQALAIIRTDQKKIEPLFVEHLLSREELQHSLTGKTVQAVQANLSLTILGETKFVVPKLDTLKQLFKPLNCLDTAIKENIRQNNTLKQLRNTLLPRLVSGKIRISN